MRINIRSKNVDLTEALQQYIEKKVGKLARHLEEAEEAQVTLSVEKNRHEAEVTMFVNGILLRGEEETGDMYSSIDQVVDKLERQIHKYKTKVNRKVRKPAIKETTGMPEVEGESPEGEPKVIRTKRFDIKPMPVEEAVMQMELLGHSFFVFANAQTQEINVVYRRRDGNYGLIEPK